MTNTPQSEMKRLIAPLSADSLPAKGRSLFAKMSKTGTNKFLCTQLSGGKTTHTHTRIPKVMPCAFIWSNSGFIGLKSPQKHNCSFIVCWVTQPERLWEVNVKIMQYASPRSGFFLSPPRPPHSFFFFFLQWIDHRVPSLRPYATACAVITFLFWRGKLLDNVFFPPSARRRRESLLKVQTDSGRSLPTRRLLEKAPLHLLFL